MHLLELSNFRLNTMFNLLGPTLLFCTYTKDSVITDSKITFYFLLKAKNQLIYKKVCYLLKAKNKLVIKLLNIIQNLYKKCL